MSARSLRSYLEKYSSSKSSFFSCEALFWVSYMEVAREFFRLANSEALGTLKKYPGI
jgi:hypothetical protein